MASSPGNYPYPSDVNVEEFVLVKLTDFNYSIWKPMMLDLLRTKGMEGFIDGTILAPPEKITVPDPDVTDGTKTKVVENPDYKDWKRSDELLRRWILKVLNADILARVAHLTTVKDVWAMIETGLFTPFMKTTLVRNEAAEGQDLCRYLPLYDATLKGDWETAQKLIQEDPNAVRNIITGASETALLIAVRSARRNHFVKKLVEKMLPADVAMQDCFGYTALHVAAAAGNIEAAKCLVEKNPLLPGFSDKSESLPIHLAASSGGRGMVLYLMTVTKEDMEIKPFEGVFGHNLVHSLLGGELYDILLSLVQRYPDLAHAEFSPLRLVALKQSAFLSGTRFHFWQRFIYSRVPMKFESLTNNRGRGDIENPADSFVSVPQIKHIRDKKLIHHQALELVKYLCMEIAKMDHEKAKSIFALSIRIAASVGNHEVVEEILASFPSAIYLRTEMQQNVFHVAIVHRREKVFNLIYQFDQHRHIHISAVDAAMNNCLHLVGYLESQHLVGSPETQQKLNLRSTAAGAALQMQRELQWFKEVEKLGLPQDKTQRNTTGKTAAIIFSETHEELAKEGEQWMKDRANSCTIVAALVVTVVFAAAITVPGGNNGDSGLPMFSKEIAFVIFAVSDVLALFSSTSSLLMFLGILTSRYALEDFLYSLPKRLIIGLVTLFLSIIFLMIAFSATVYLVFADKEAWILILVSVLACIPVTLFASLQFLPLMDMIKSTYGPGIFRKQSDRILF